MSAMAGTLQELLDNAGFEGQYLNQQCSEKHLVEIAAHYCDNWQMIGQYLNLIKNEISAINNDYMTTKEKRVGVLMKWREKFSHKATYKVLIEAFLSNKEVDTARQIIEWLRNQSE
jgi:hypothetical protein